MPSPSSEDRPIIKSRTGKFLQGIFGKDSKDNPDSEASGAAVKSAAETPAEFLQMVPEPTTWDEDTEESNWDDDFMEAPAPFTTSMPATEPVNSAPPAPPAPPVEPVAAVDEALAVDEDLVRDEAIAPTDSAISPEIAAEATLLMQETLRELTAPSNPPQAQAASEPSRPPAPPPPPPIPTSPVASGGDRGPVEVNIPRPKNIKYKNKPNDAEPTASPSQRELTENRRESGSTGVERAMSKPASNGDDQAIELHIKRPTSIKYKTKAPEPTGPIAKIQNLLSKFLRPAAPSATPAAANSPNDTSLVKSGFKLPALKFPPLPSLAMADRKQILTIATAVFLALTAAWATINFWPHAAAVATAPTAQPVVSSQPVVNPQPVVSPQPVVNPKTELVQAAPSKLEALAAKYPTGLINNLELTEERQLATVVVSSQWFNLSVTQRQQTAQNLWLQAVEYKMPRLEVRGGDGRLLARSPVVGGEAIVLDNF